MSLQGDVLKMKINNELASAQYNVHVLWNEKLIYY